MSDFKAKMYQIQFRLGLRPDPDGGAYTRGKGVERIRWDGREGDPKGWFTPHVQNPEKFPNCGTYLNCRCGNTDVCPGRQTPSRRHCWEGCDPSGSDADARQKTILVYFEVRKCIW